MTTPRILIVEDEAVTVLSLKRELAALGCEVVAAADSTEEAVQIAENTKPDLVLMDITLAGRFDGITAAVAIRGSIGAPVVFLTAHADTSTMERAMLAGPFGYLVKPFTTPELNAAIQLALHKHRSECEFRESQAGPA